jgi:protein-S-isoprenylcysteine O-methyltransferase
LNHSREYHLAAIAAFSEYLLEAFFFRSLKAYGWNVYAGLCIVMLSQILRSAAMMTAGSNFNHFVQETKDENHQLVKHGVYSFFRHPSYTGFFYWGVGMQLLLFNPACFLLNIFVISKFFAGRIPHEEETLVEFFGDEYVEYRKTTWVLIPFVK